MSNANDIIICAGLSCLDLQLLGCTKSGAGEESIEHYDRAVYCAGGSASMTATALGLLLRTDGSGGTEVHVLTKLGSDLDGDRMLSFYSSAGADPSLTLVDPSSRTSMAVLPVFTDGRRGCFVNLACNDSFSADELLGRLDRLSERLSSVGTGGVRAFLFGYPHLLPKMQGEELKRMLGTARTKLGSGSGSRPLIGVDLNGVSPDNHSPSLLRPALTEVDVLHLNEEEASIVCPNGDTASLHSKGCAVILLSLGSAGCRITTSSDAERLSKCPGRPSGWEAGTDVRVPAYKIDGEVNANGAGDALFAGFCLAATWPMGEDDGLTVGPKEAGMFASLVARQRCDIRTRDGTGEEMKGAEDLMRRVQKGDLPEAISP